jgi:hypothetical protein
MKTAIIIAEGIKQIMFTPENDSERQALKMITPDDDISIEVKHGTFYDTTPISARGYTVQKCQGGFLRAYDSEESLMLVLKRKSKDDAPQEEVYHCIDNPYWPIRDD